MGFSLVWVAGDWEVGKRAACSANILSVGPLLLLILLLFRVLILLLFRVNLLVSHCFGYLGNRDGIGLFAWNWEVGKEAACSAKVEPWELEDRDGMRGFVFY